MLGPILKEIVDRASLKFNCLEAQQNACEQVVNDVQKIKDLKFYFYSAVAILLHFKFSTKNCFPLYFSNYIIASF